jgi:hypothetical protein
MNTPTNAEIEAAHSFLATDMPLAEMQAVPALDRVLNLVARKKIGIKKRRGCAKKHGTDFKKLASNDME